MADTFLISFRIADAVVDNLDYDDRYENLKTQIKMLAEGKYWEETTSFFAIKSSLSIDALAGELEAAIAPNYDIILLIKTEFKAARIIGALEDRDIFELIPYLK